jgi:hypothetical protein
MIRTILWSIIGALIVCATYAIVQTLDDQRTDDMQAAKALAHRKAVRLREAGLIHDANQMVWPCCQMVEK